MKSTIIYDNRNLFYLRLAKNFIEKLKRVLKNKLINFKHS